MKKFLFVISLLAALQLSARPLPKSEILTDRIHSSILGQDVPFNVYLPAGFDYEAQQQYPVVYLLHGLTDTYSAWAEKGYMKDVVDQLIISGEATPMVIIMPNAGDPDCHNVLNGYFNTPGRAYEDFFFKELIPQLEAKFHCYSDKAHRAIMGLSMGGGGSTVYAQRHPEMFSSCYAIDRLVGRG